MVIAFSGLDGSGKSSTIRCLIAENKAKGIRSCVVWSRVGYTPGFQLLKDLLRKCFGRLIPEPGHSERRNATLRIGAVRAAWLVIACFDFAVFHIVYVRFLKLKNHIVYLDRTIEDSFIDLSLFAGQSGVENQAFRVWFNVVNALSPVQAKFLFEISVELSDIRCAEKYDPFPDDRQTKLIRSTLYKRAQFENRYDLILNSENDFGSNIKKIREFSMP